MNAIRPLLRRASAPLLTALAVTATLAAAPLAAIEPAAADGAPRDAQIQVAELAVSAGDCRRASETYAKAAAAQRDPRIARRAVEVAVGCSHLPAAWQSAQRWLALDPENVDALRAAGLVALELHRIDDARRVFADLLAKPDVEADRALGDLLPLVTAGDHALAAWMTFGTVVDRNAVDDASRLALADLAIEADNYAAARSLAESVIARDADNATAHRTLSLLQAADDQAEPSLASARRAALLDPANQSFAVAEALAALDRNEEAHVELLRLLDDEALRDEAERRLAMLALQSGDFDEARQRFGARLQRGVASAESFFYLALLAERRGDKDLALQSYERLVAAGGGLLPRMRAASLMIGAGRRADALKLLDDVPISSRDDIIDLPIARSNLLHEAGADKEALAAIDAAITKHPEHPQLLYQRAMLLERSGRTRDAVKVFERLLAARPRDASVQNALGYTLGDRKMQLARADRLVQAALAEMPDVAVLAVPGGPLSYTARREIIAGLGVAPQRFARVVHPAARIARIATLGTNVLVMAGVVVTSNVVIGDHVCVLPNTVIHHDVTIGSYSLVGANVAVAGGVSIGENCYVASGSNIKNGVRIGDRALIGMGSNVLKDVAADTRVAGNPAKELVSKERT